MRNDARILEAALDLADRQGWQGLSVLQVAEAAGLSRPTVLNRFKGRPSIASGLWSTLIADPLREALDRLVDACIPGGSGLTPHDLWTVLEPFALPDRTMRAAAELIIVGRYEPLVGDTIAATLVPDLTAWLDSGRSPAGRVGAAVRAFACNLALGLLIESRRHPLDDMDFTVDLARTAAALANPATPVALPRANARHLDRVANFDTGDEDLNDLLRATLEEVAAHGYEAATIERIAGATDRTPGFVFSRYASKRELFLDANWKYSAVAASLNEAFIRRVAQASSDAIAEAVTTRELMRPERRHVMSVSLETYRLSWHDPAVLEAIDAGYADVIREHAEQAPGRTPAQAQARLAMELARGNGPLVLAGLSDTAWKLPYDVVTVPLAEGD